MPRNKIFEQINSSSKIINNGMKKEQEYLKEIDRLKVELKAKEIDPEEYIRIYCNTINGEIHFC